jgi:penicillin-binding protein 2
MDILSRILIARLKIVALLAFGLFSAIIFYLFHLQITHASTFFRLGQQNFLRYEKVSSPRGNIVDAHGIVLATNIPVYLLYWQGTGEKQFTSLQMSMISELKAIFELSDELIKEIALAERQRKSLCLSYDVSFEQLSRLLERFPRHKNIAIQKDFKRFYPYKQIASHVVGYLGLDIEATGKMGLELLCNDTLKGQAGEIIKIINSIGHHLACHQVKQAMAGDTLHITLNLELQMLMEELFPQEYAGACVILNPRTGAVEVLVSRPAFDPSIFLSPINPEEWKDLESKKSFINRALSAYPPASLFKFVTLSAALETGLITPNTKWHCFGHTLFANRPYHCNRLTGHGSVNTEQALAYSCNIPFFEIGKKIKIDTLAEYAQRLGLGSKTNILFHEKAGLIPTSQWKKRVKGEAWWPGETLSAAIGQSFMLATPMQIARMISALCEGYLVQPRILTAEPIVKQPISLRPEILQFLRKCMKSVIYYGTGLYLKSLPDFEFYGKTGTAQTSSLEKIDLGKEYVPHAWFTAYFRYKDQEPHTLVLLIEHAGSSKVAIRLAQQFFKRYRDLQEQRTHLHLSPSASPYKDAA